MSRSLTFAFLTAFLAACVVVSPASGSPAFAGRSQGPDQLAGDAEVYAGRGVSELHIHLENGGKSPIQLNALADLVAVKDRAGRVFECSWVAEEGTAEYPSRPLNPTEKVTLLANCTGIEPASVEAVDLSMNLRQIAIELAKPSVEPPTTKPAG